MRRRGSRWHQRSLFALPVASEPGSTLTVVESEVFSVASGQKRLVSKATATIAVVASGRA